MMNLRTLRRWSTSGIDALTISSSIYWALLQPIACSQRSHASMYKGLLTHSLLCSKFVELTLKLIGGYEQSFDCAENRPYLLRKRSVLFDQKVRTFQGKGADYFFAYVSLGTVASHFHITTFVFEYSTSC